MTNKDTIDKLNRLEFFYWHKPTKTPEVLEQDKEQVKRDFALIRKDLEVLEILKKYLKVSAGKDEKGFPFLLFKSDEDYELLWSMEEYQLLKEWLENEKNN